MKRGIRAQGFTIVEVAIVLAVTSALLISAMMLFAGKQADVQFNQSVNDVQLQINRIINNVQTGYYARPANFYCTPGVGLSAMNQRPIISSGSGTEERGTNVDCTFVGRAIQFGVLGTNGTGYNVYNMVGRQYAYGTKDTASNIIEANPRSMPDGDGYEETNRLLFGLQARKMRYGIVGSIPVDKITGIVVFMSNFGQATTGGNTTTKMYAVKEGTGSKLDQSATSAVTHLSAAQAVNLESNTTIVTICFDGGTDKYGIVTIGSSNRQLSTKVDIINNNPLPPGPLGTACS